MAKKFVRGVTGVDDIEKLDKSLTNVNDLISDGQNTYVHTKKGKKEFYYKVTDGVTSVKSTDSTITVEKSDDGTVNLNTNPQKVLEHDNLQVYYGISKTNSGNTTKLGIEYTQVPDGFDLNTLYNGRVISGKFANSPLDNTYFFVTSYSLNNNNIVQEAVKLYGTTNVRFIRSKQNNSWSVWSEQLSDSTIINSLLSQKQNTITNNTSIGVSGDSLRQLYTKKQIYTVAGIGSLKTYVKSISENTRISTPEEEFNFIVQIRKDFSLAIFNLNEQDTTKFTKIIATYGSNNTVNISGCLFTLSGSALTVSKTNNTNQNYVITFSDII